MCSIHSISRYNDFILDLQDSSEVHTNQPVMNKIESFKYSSWLKFQLLFIDTLLFTHYCLNILNFILIIAKQLAVTINKNNTTAVSAASKPHSRLVKSKTLQSKWMFPASTKKRFNPIAAIEYETSNLNNLYLWMNIPMNPIKTIQTKTNAD